ncbi:uncharacterized protein [Amphiura filiformis]|uniref:uncharacterized protein n=1 Tax=Amphiura filiformis TaxID=82378 RepID=UPI003B21F783
MIELKEKTNKDNDNISAEEKAEEIKRKEKWVVNISDRALSEDEKSVLSRGLNFAVSPKEIPVSEFVTSTESVCKLLNDENEAEIVQAEAIRVLKSCKPPKNNISKGERTAIQDLKKDDNIVILPADKGRSTVIMNKSDYIKKSNDLLNDTTTYKKLKTDPTSKHKKQLVSILTKLKDQVVSEDEQGKVTAISKQDFWKMYPTSETTPRYYGLPKIHKAAIPLRPIISGIGSIAYETANFCARIISPLVGNTPYHIKNTLDFVEKIRGISLSDEEEMVSYDVTALFTSVPVEEALDTIHARLERDTTLHERTNLDPSQVVELLRFVLTTTYFTFQNQVYQQIEGAAMGSPCSPLTANIFMEEFEEVAINTSPVKPSYWGRYVDDTMVVLKRDDIDIFTQHLNSVNPAIKFTIEREVNGKIPMLDTLLHRKPDGSIKVTVYQKPTHTNQYLSFESHHPLQHKLSVVRTLMHRADTCITEDVDKNLEKENIKKSLRLCGYGDWVFNVAQPVTPQPRQHDIHEKPHIGSIVIPYVRGASEALRRIFTKRGVSVHFKPSNTLRSALVAPKDKVPPGKCCGTVYQVNCQDCDSAYVGETARQLNT